MDDELNLTDTWSVKAEINKNNDVHYSFATLSSYDNILSMV